ncbi:MAG: ribosome assembly factor SBDS [Candidatus Woesearchaeota archaeon]
MGGSESRKRLNVARLRKGGDYFEVVINPEAALRLKQKRDVSLDEVSEAVVYPKIFSDANKGLLAPEKRLKAVFGTTDPLQVCLSIIRDGEIQLTQEQREKALEEKRRRIIDLIHTNGIDPRTGLPHPIQRIEAALAQSKVRISESLPAESQLPEILKSLHRILPIKFITKQLLLTIPIAHAAKCKAQILLFGRIVKEEWTNETWKPVVEIPGGLEQELYEKLNSILHGALESQIIALKE